MDKYVLSINFVSGLTWAFNLKLLKFDLIEKDSREKVVYNPGPWLVGCPGNEIIALVPYLSHWTPMWPFQQCAPQTVASLFDRFVVIHVSRYMHEKLFCDNGFLITPRTWYIWTFLLITPKMVFTSVLCTLIN